MNIQLGELAPLAERLNTVTGELNAELLRIESLLKKFSLGAWLHWLQKNIQEIRDKHLT